MKLKFWEPNVKKNTKPSFYGLKFAMLKHNIKSYKELASLLNWNTSTLYSKLQHKRKVNLEEAKEIANYFNSSIEDIFYKEDE